MSGSEEVEAFIEALTMDVRSASYDRMGEFSARIETILAILPSLDKGALMRIRVKAERCSACLTAAAQGLRAGQRRLAEIAAADTLATYDRSGSRQALPVEGGGRRL